MNDNEIKEKVYARLMKSPTSYESFAKFAEKEGDGFTWPDKFIHEVIKEARQDELARREEDIIHRISSKLDLKPKTKAQYRVIIAKLQKQLDD